MNGIVNFLLEFFGQLLINDCICCTGWPQSHAPMLIFIFINIIRQQRTQRSQDNGLVWFVHVEHL